MIMSLPIPTHAVQNDTVDALNERIAELRMRILVVGAQLGPETPDLGQQEVQPVPEAKPKLTVVDRVQEELGTGGGPAVKRQRETRRKLRKRSSGPDRTEELGVAISSDLDSWMTDGVAHATPAAIPGDDPITAEMDAITKPSVYDALVPDENERLWRSVAPQSVSPTQTDDYQTYRDESMSHRWMTVAVVTIVLVGLALIATLWLNTGADDAAAGWYGFLG